jgi:hypothetical protein
MTLSYTILTATISALFPTSDLIRSSNTLVEIRHYGYDGMYGFTIYSTDELISLFNQKCQSANKG